MKEREAMIPLTYEALMRYDPFFHSDILAGWNGKKNKCEYAILNKLPTENNSVLLIEYSNESLSLLEKGIINSSVSGIIIFGDKLGYIESSITDLANKVQKPLLFLNNHVEESIYNKLSIIISLNKNDLSHLMKNDLAAYWLTLFFKHSIEHVLSRLNTFFGQEVLFITKKKQLLTPKSESFNTRDLAHLQTVNNETSLDDKGLKVVTNGRIEFYSYRLVDHNDQLIGHFIFEKTHPLEDIQLQFLQSLTPTIITWLNQLKLTNQVHLKYRDQFLFDILHNNLDTENELIELGKLREMEFTSNGYVLTMHLISNQTIKKEVYLNIQNLIDGAELPKTNIYTTFLNQRIVAIICPSGKSITIDKNSLTQWIKNVQKEIQHILPDIHSIVGVGRRYDSPLNIYKSFQEAKIALQMEVYGLGTDGIIYYEDIGYVRLLSYVHNDLLRDFSYQHLGELEKHDRENGTELIHTLSIYCNQDGDILRTADHLFIHQNTLRQRLKKIESILNVELHQYTHLVNLILSLKILQEMNQ